MTQRIGRALIVDDDDGPRHCLSTAQLARAGHTLVAQIESSLERATGCVSEDVASLLAWAADRLTEPPPAMLTYLERTFKPPGVEGDRRQSDRVSLLATVTAAPMSAEFQTAGEPFKATARDVSRGGMSLLHTRAVASKYLALRWQGLSSMQSYVTVALRLTRCAPMGPFYELAGEFVTLD